MLGTVYIMCVSCQAEFGQQSGEELIPSSCRGRGGAARGWVGKGSGGIVV